MPTNGDRVMRENRNEGKMRLFGVWFGGFAMGSGVVLFVQGVHDAKRSRR